MRFCRHVLLSFWQNRLFDGARCFFRPFWAPILIPTAYAKKSDVIFISLTAYKHKKDKSEDQKWPKSPHGKGSCQILKRFRSLCLSPAPRNDCLTLSIQDSEKRSPGRSCCSASILNSRAKNSSTKFVKPLVCGVVPLKPYIHPTPNSAVPKEKRKKSLEGNKKCKPLSLSLMILLLNQTLVLSVLFLSFFHSGNLLYMGFPVIRQISLLGFQ